MQISSQKVVGKILGQKKATRILDCPSGGGWLLEYAPNAVVDSIDLYEEGSTLYANHYAIDLDNGLPDDLASYDVIACCEGIEHFGNPELFFRTTKKHLNPEGMLIITTPNTWHAAAKLQYSHRGFFPSFPCLVGKINKGSHMHIMPWSFPQLYLYLRLCGYQEITLHEQELSKPKHFYERVLSFPQILYCRRKAKKAKTKEEVVFWTQAASTACIMGRHLIVTAKV